MFKKLVKKSMRIPYDDISVYPTVAIAKEAIADYCSKQGLEYEFIEAKEENNILVHIDGMTYEVIRGLAERGCYGIRCREL
ncbi:DUF4318 domain-containing protein [Bacillus sp. 1P06AnD]|uniref:DUF4318 domain-containing protein n=1 Tax=Bacillus sp. 1P06AnD TaxID=3132208 RepID=UPI0039A19FD7